LRDEVENSIFIQVFYSLNILIIIHFSPYFKYCIVLIIQMSIFYTVSSSVRFTSICSCRYFHFPSGCDNKFTFIHVL